MKQKVLLGILILIFTNCGQSLPENEISFFPSIHYVQKNRIDLSESEKINWYTKDIFADTIPGISSEKAYKEILDKKNGDTVIVAIIDMPIKIQHKELERQIWINYSEIPDNNLDDDDNGYVDDINGWNFLGGKNNTNSNFVNYEYTRIIRKYDPTFQGKEIEQISLENQSDFLEYTRAKETHSKQLEYAKAELKNASGLYEFYVENNKVLRKYFPNGVFEIKKLDSLKKTTSNKQLKMQIDAAKEFIQYDISKERIDKNLLKAEERINKLLNLKFNDRTFIGDDPEDLSDSEYGNNNVSHNSSLLDHGTFMAGIIAARRNGENVDGISNYIKIMPICISAYGDELDKDMALAIRYAVDNGAKVINISSGKYFSLHPEWVLDAIIYAEKNDVLIITSAGNRNLNLDENIKNYPNDTKNDTIEIAKNFIKVGASGFDINSSLKYSDSNYGLTQVDIFAPGVSIYTTDSSKEYSSINGTSAAAAIVSGVSAMLRSYYPELSAPQIKFILLNSGIDYNTQVDIVNKENQKIKIPFNELSRSGKIVNAYNALLLAEKMVKKKK